MQIIAQNTLQKRAKLLVDFNIAIHILLKKSWAKYSSVTKGTESTGIFITLGYYPMHVQISFIINSILSYFKKAPFFNTCEVGRVHAMTSILRSVSARTCVSDIVGSVCTLS